MALQKQVIPIPFAQGIDTKSDPKQVVAGKLLSLFNGVFQSAKRILKRYGFIKISSSIDSGGNILKGIALKAFNEEMTLQDGGSFFSYINSDQKWRGITSITPVGVSQDEIVSSATNIIFRDSAYHTDGYLGYAYLNHNDGVTTNKPLFICVKDQETNTTVINYRLSTNSRGAKIVAMGKYFIVVNWSLTTNQLEYFAIDTTDFPTVPTAVPITSDLTTGGGNPFSFDVIVNNGNTYIAYNVSAASAGPKIAFYYLTPSLVLSSKLPSNIATAHGGVLTIFSDVDFNVWLAYANVDTPGIYVSIYSEFIASTVLPNTNTDSTAYTNVVRIVGGVVIESPTRTCILYYEDVGSTNNGQHIISNYVNILGGFNAASILKRSVKIYSKPFIRGENSYLLVNYQGNPQTNLQPTAWLMSDSGLLLVRVLPLQVSNYAVSQNPLLVAPNANQISADEYEITGLMSTTIGAFDGGTLDVNTLVSERFQFLSTGIVSTVLGNNLLFGNGRIWMYDGLNMVEHGFDVFPENVIVTSITASGGSISQGTYQYAAVYEWIDAQGQRHRSAPSPILLNVVVASPSSTVHLSIPTLRLTKKTGVIISIYRTGANGATLRRVSSIPSVSLYGANENNPNTDVLLYNDVASDAIQSGGDILYTTGGEVENICAPASSAICSYRGRLILAPSEVDNNFWYSKLVIPGVPVETSDLFVQNIDELGGVITGVSQMDDKLIIFKSRNIFYMSGQGPSDNGANNDFSTPLLVNSDVGAINQNSIVQMPNGVMFKSEKGIYLLDRSLQASYIGVDVEAYNQYDVTSSQLLLDVNQVRFTLSNGVQLMYDYFFQQWCVDSNISAVDSCFFEGKYTYLKSDGSTYQEDPGTYTDDGAFIPLSGTTAWLSFSGVQGFQRIYKALFLGEQKGNHQLQVGIAYNFDPTIVETYIIDATAISPTVYQWRIFPARQKCESIQFTFTDVQTSGFNEGFSISDLTLEVGGKGGVFKLPASQSF